MSFTLAASDPSAGGAPTDQIAIATGAGLALSVALLVLCIGHRSGRVGVLAAVSSFSERWGGLPGWAGVPGTIALVTLLPALFGLQWDESLHIAQGRDEGPLANPSHYFLLLGIYGIFAAGVIGMALADDRPLASRVRITRDWHVPLGAVLATGGAAAALVGFPLDDVWHRLFGQDVTLWSPTHVLMIGGLSLAVLGMLILQVEALRVRGPSGRRRGLPSLTGRVAAGVQWVMLPASLLLVLSLLQGEFDFGVPQFRLVFHPMLIMAAAGGALVAARVFMGPGAALGAAVAFVAIRGVIALLVGPLLGEPDHVFPLYLAEAAIVELVALRVSVRRPLAFGLWCGALIGTVGLAAEWAWSNVFPIPWPAELLPEALLLAPAMALAGAVLGAWMGAHLMVKDPIRSPALRRGAVVAAVAVTAMVGYGLNKPDLHPIRAQVALTEVTPAPERTVQATVRLDPPGAAAGAEWLRTVSWQGGGFATEPLRKIGDGVYRTTAPVPVYGNWKSAIRLARGAELGGLPIFLPADDAIPVREVPATARFDRPLLREKTVLQREAEAGSSLQSLANVIVAGILFGMLALWAAALHRLSVAGSRGVPPAPVERSRAGTAPAAPAGVPA